MERKHAVRGIFYGLLFLVFFQLLAEFIEAVYAFGLLGTGVPPEIVAVLLLLSPLLLIPFGRRAPAWLADILLAGALLARVFMPLPGTYGRMGLAGIGTAAWLMLFPLLLWYAQDDDGAEQASCMGAGLMLAVLASALLRTITSGLDASTVGWGQVVGWGIVAALAWIWWGGKLGARHEPVSNGHESILLPTLGLMAALTLLYFVFTAPHVLARWTGVDYRWILVLFALATCGWGWLFSRGLSRTAVFGATVGLVAALALTALVHQVAFPPTPDAYPLPEAHITPLHHIPLVLTLLLFPVLFLDVTWLVGRVLSARPSVMRLGGSFALASFFLLVMIFAHVFTTTYDYIPVIGPFFRDRFWLVHLVVGLVLLAALPEVWSITSARVGDMAGMLPPVLALALVTIVAGFLVTARPAPPAQAADRLTVLTYNVQQGYSADGQRNFAGQLAVMRGVAPDVIGLQETDDARVANGNADIVRYFANHLNMYEYYGPKSVTGTFGIALLSRYPIQNPRTWFLYSKGEQVAVIQAQIFVGGRTFNVFVTHLGNEGPIVQQRQFLSLVRGKENVIAMGDFNFRPDTEQYRITTEVLVDTWTARWPTWEDERGVAPRRKIDHIFVSPNLRVLDARYLPKGPSDHPAVAAVIGW